MSAPAPLSPYARWIVWIALAATASGLLLAVGQPLWTDDTWWHLALGEAYASRGPWLEADPLLFTAPGPPVPAAWLSDLAFHGVAEGLGLHGLRALHVVLVVAILGFAYRLLRKETSPALAALGVLAFAAMAAYRLVQLRPHLFAMLALLALLALVVLPKRSPSWQRVGASVGLIGLWANLHASFLVGPGLVAIFAFGEWLAGRGARPRDPEDGDRLKKLAAVVVLGLLATLVNPGGVAPHLTYFVADGATPALTRISDEWAPLTPFSWPAAGLPPDRTAFLVYWALLLGSGASLVALVRRRNLTPRDGGLAAMALACLAAPLVAVRFLWLGAIPILWVASALPRVIARPGPSLGGAIAASALGLAAGFYTCGAWPSMSSGIPRHAAGYAAPYAAGKYHAHAAFMLRDAGLEGRMFQEYAHGGFLGYALAPRIQTFVNGSLNVPPEILDVNRAIREHRGLEEGQSLLELLDDLEIDLFFGIRLPVSKTDARPWYYTSRHLDGAPGWIPIFRNIDTTVYLRTNEANRDNLTRVERYYATRGVPYDPAVGFDIARVLSSDSGQWNYENAVGPVHLYELITAATSVEISDRLPAREQLASLFAGLGMCSRALRYDRQALRETEDHFTARKRRVWCLLQERRLEEARDEAETLLEHAELDAVGRRIAETAKDLPGASDAETLARLATLPLFGPAQAAFLRSSFAPPEPRALR